MAQDYFDYKFNTILEYLKNFDSKIDLYIFAYQYRELITFMDAKLNCNPEFKFKVIIQDLNYIKFN